MPIAKLNDIEIFYDTLGEQNKETVLLISGLGSPLTAWKDSFCQLLVEKGFKVIRFDNRDTGLSSFITHGETSMEVTISHLQQGRVPKNAYQLQDMAKDAIALLDWLKIDKAHVIGRSMGGIIAQIIAKDYPDRTASLTAIMSTSQKPNLPKTKPEIMALMLRPYTDVKTNPELYYSQKIEFAKAIAGSCFPIDEREERQHLERDIARAPQANVLGHICAMSQYIYDEEALSRINVPTLVVHGTEDPIFSIECGSAIVDVIPHARLLSIDGLGHNLPNAVNTLVVETFLEIIQ